MNMEEIKLENFILDISKVNLENPIDEQLINIQNTYDIDDMNKIINILDKLNKNKIKAIKRSINTPNKKEENTITLFAKEDIEKLFKANDLKNIEKEHTKKEIKNMYVSLLGTEPLSSYNKTQILKNIEYYFKSKKRVTDIEKSYQITY